MIILNAWSPGPARYCCPRPAGLSRSTSLLVSVPSARYWCPRPAGLSRSRSLLVPAAFARYWCPRPAGLSRSKSLLVPAARGALEVVVVIGDRGLCSLLVPEARGALEVEVVTGARGLCSLLVPAAKSRRSLLAGLFRGQIRARKVGATKYDSLFRFSVPETNGKQPQEPAEPPRWPLSGPDPGPETRGK